MRSLGNKMIFLGIAGMFLSNELNAQHQDEFISRCGTYERDSARSAQDSRWRMLRELNENSIADYKATRRLKSARLLDDQEIITIPVVVHLVSQDPDDFSNPSSNPNLTDDQVRSQIEVLNEDYRRMRNTPGFNTDERGGDSFIQFRLAEYDIAGKPVGEFSLEEKRFSGINRVRTTKESFRICNTCTTEEELSDLTYERFPPTNYLNIWVCRLTGGYLGVAQFPLGSALNGLDTEGLIEKTDGVIIDYRYFGRAGTNNTNRLYSDGRTTTHEVGHWLGLRHIWGDSYCGDDFVDDTPTADGKNENSCEERFTACPSEAPNTLKMIENFMDYTPDKCMNIFTKGQIERMRTVLETSPLRRELVRNSKLSQLKDSPQLAIDMFPNPSTEWMQLGITFEGERNITVSVYNLSGDRISTSSYLRSKSRYIPVITESLVPGVYVVRIEAGNEQISKKFIVE